MRIAIGADHAGLVELERDRVDECVIGDGRSGKGQNGNVLSVGSIITGIFILVAAVALVLHASRPPRIVYHEVNDRGLVIHDRLYPFLSLDSFWIPHDEFPPKIILKSRKLFMPFIIIFIDEIDPEEVREVMLRYIAETEHHEPFLKFVLERLGF